MSRKSSELASERTSLRIVRVRSDNVPRGFMVYEVPERFLRYSHFRDKGIRTVDTAVVHFGHYLCAFFPATGWHTKNPARPVTREQAAVYESAPWAHELDESAWPWKPEFPGDRP